MPAMSDADDVLKNAGRMFQKLGGQLKDTAKLAGTQLKQTTKQVTGLGRGSVRLELEQTRVAPGGTLRGRLVLALSEPVDAKRLVVTLRARRKILAISGSSITATYEPVFSFDQEVGGGKTYESQTIAFALPVPPDALERRAPSVEASAVRHPIADAVRSVASALSPSPGLVEWLVTGRLEIAWGRDLTADVDIMVAP